MPDFLKPLYHIETAQCVLAERAVSSVLGGSCQVPLGAFAEIADGKMRLRAFVASPDGSRMIRAEEVGAPEAFEAIGKAAAEKLLDGGAGEILAALAI